MINLKNMPISVCTADMVEGMMYLAVAKNRHISNTGREVIVKFVDSRNEPFYAFCDENCKWTFAQESVFVEENYRIENRAFNCDFTEV